MQSDIAKAVELWRSAIGAEYVLTERSTLSAYEANANGIERRIPAVVKPASREEVQSVVKIANECRVALYPISAGKNWGYGSRLPVTDNTVVVDLARMNRIRNGSEIGHHNPYLVIEPGVTQRQLLAFLESSKLPFTFNVSAAGSDTSVLGNGLDRGVGYWGSRTEDLSCLEVVLGTGEVLTTGYGHIANAKAKYHYKTGIGPSLDGLFYQSNFGIVTAAAFRLMPKFERHAAVVINVDDDSKLEELIVAMGELRALGAVQALTHIGNKERALCSLAPLIYQQLVAEGWPKGLETKRQAEDLLSQEKFGAWNAFAGLSGSKKQVSENYAHIKKRVSKFASTMLITKEKVALGLCVLKALRFIPALGRKYKVLVAAQPLHQFCMGAPSNEILPSVPWSAGHIDVHTDDVDGGPGGIIFCNPAIPLDPVLARELVECIRSVFAKYHCEPYMTLNVQTAHSLVCVVNVSFDRTDKASTQNGQACAEECLKELIKRGFYPYRAGIQTMDLLVDAQDSYWQYVKGLKNVFDPNGIIAPGRYCLR